MKISLLGPPGTGKGSYAKKLGEDFRVPVISVGDLLRDEVGNKSEVGKKAEKYMNKGELVPNKVILEVVNKNLEGKDLVIFDGFPRNMQQASVNMDSAINVTCSDKLCIERIVNRRICKKCNRIYNLITKKPKRKDKCDICGGKLISRSDQTLEVVKERLRVFKRETLPVINYYKKKKILEEVDGERSINEVYRDIRKLFKSKK